MFSLYVLLWISICSTQMFSSSSLVFILKINGISSCEANHLHYLTEWWTFLRQDDDLALYQQLTGLQLPPAHDPGQSIPRLNNQQLNIQTHWLPHKLSTLSPQIPTKSCLLTIIINLSLLIFHLYFCFFLVWNHINDGWICFHWLHNFFIAENRTLAHRRYKA